MRRSKPVAIKREMFIDGYLSCICDVIEELGDIFKDNELVRKVIINKLTKLKNEFVEGMKE